MLRGIVPHQKDGVRPLVSADEWEQAKRLLSRRTCSRVSTGVQRTHLFSSLIACASCGRSLHRCVTGYHRVRWKCCYAPCDWYGRSIKESLVRTQAVEALRTESPRMAREAQRANNAKAKEKSAVQVEAENKLAALLQLQESGVPELGRSPKPVIRSLLLLFRRLVRTGKGLPSWWLAVWTVPVMKNSA